jgi:hypothetical protein
VTINLYRRHRQECEAGHPEDSRSGEFEERRKGWKRCACPIYASGMLAGKFKRKSTGFTDWEQAKELISSWKTCGGKLPVPSPAAEQIPASTPRITIERAVDAFLAVHAESSAPTTHRMNRHMMNRFKSFSEFKGYILLDQLAPIDVREFRATWQVAPNTATKNTTILKSFFEFATSNGWLGRNPARALKGIRNRSGEKHAKERIPFIDEELARMFQACGTKYGETEDEFRYRWNGQDLADFISVSVYTGLRISDVCTFHNNS